MLLNVVFLLAGFICGLGFVFWFLLKREEADTNSREVAHVDIEQELTLLSDILAKNTENGVKIDKLGKLVQEQRNARTEGNDTELILKKIDEAIEINALANYDVGVKIKLIGNEYKKMYKELIAYFDGLKLQVDNEN